MRTLLLFFIWISSSFLSAQTFYEKIMEMNIANADTSNDRPTLDLSAKAMERVSRGVSNNWDVAFHSALCYVRITDISLIKKDTVGAKIALVIAATNLKKVDTMRPADPECKILMFYHKINEFRLAKTDPKAIDLLETQLESFKKINALNPRIRIVNAYFYRCFYFSNKAKRKKALDLLQEATKLFETEKPGEFKTKWGKKWMNELSTELNLKRNSAKTK